MQSSLSARRAWIEITQFVPITTSDVVALRKESVDRNPSVGGKCKMWVVALRKESVDRNVAILGLCRAGIGSLSARRAWIEIQPSKQCAEIVKRRSPQGERG